MRRSGSVGRLLGPPDIDVIAGQAELTLTDLQVVVLRMGNGAVEDHDVVWAWSGPDATSRRKRRDRVKRRGKSSAAWRGRRRDHPTKVRRPYKRAWGSQWDRTSMRRGGWLRGATRRRSGKSRASAPAPGTEAFSGHTPFDEPGDEGLGPALGGLPIEGAAPAAIGAIGVADDPKVDVWVGLEPGEEFLSHGEALGMEAFAIALEVDAQNVGPEAGRQGAKGNPNLGFVEQVGPERLGMEHVAGLVADERVAAVRHNLEKRVPDGGPAAGSAVLVSEEHHVTLGGKALLLDSQPNWPVPRRDSVGSMARSAVNWASAGREINRDRARARRVRQTFCQRWRATSWSSMRIIYALFDEIPLFED